MTSNNDWGPWIGWNGGECPVGGGDEVEVVWSAGLALKTTAGAVSWGANAAPPCAYRVKRKPVVEEVRIVGGKSSGFSFYQVFENCGEDYRITFTTIDGIPDCSSIRMTEIGEVE